VSRSAKPRTIASPSASSEGAPQATEDLAPLEAILAKSPSPFSDAVLPNAFRETPDVPAIHAAARERCLALIHEARQTGRTAVQVITGDAGEGKTHLIAWLRRQSEEGWRKGTAGGRFALTVIPPLRSLARTRHHILQEVVRQLSIRLPGDIHVDEATDTPIEIVLWRALLAVTKLLVGDRSTPAELRARLEDVASENPDKHLSFCVEQLKHVWKTIGSAFVDAALRLPELAAADREVFRVVARFPEGGEPERTAIVDWLGGASLSSERLDGLGTSLVLDEEPEATRGLLTLLALGQLATTPVALAFDQIEGTARLGPDAVSTFLDAIAQLYNDAPGTVLFVFCQAQLWPTLHQQAAGGVRDRLDDAGVVHLKGLTTEEALALVETRMKHFWDGTGVRPTNCLLPLARGQVRAIVQREGLRTPRAVIRYFQAFLRETPERRVSFTPPSPLPPADVVRRKLDALIEEERHTARPPDARAALTQSITEEILAQASASARLVKGARVEEVTRHRASKTAIEGLRVVLRSGDDCKRVYLETSNTQNGKSAASTVKRLADVLTADQADVALLVREEAFPLPPAARKMLIELTPRGAMLRLAEGEVAPLAAIESLLNAAAARDLPVDRKTALDIAVQHLESALTIGDRVVEEAFSAAAPSKNVSDRGSEEKPERPSIDPMELESHLEAILDYLRRERAFEPAAQLASTLRISIESVDTALGQLSARRLVDVVTDRNRSPVVLLRLEALLP
jgi:hypothetical protein